MAWSSRESDRGRSQGQGDQDFERHIGGGESSARLKVHGHPGFPRLFALAVAASNEGDFAWFWLRRENSTGAAQYQQCFAILACLILPHQEVDRSRMTRSCTYQRAGSLARYGNHYSIRLVPILTHRIPCISMRCALWKSRSRVPSASVGSPICSCQRDTGSCKVGRVERT